LPVAERRLRSLLAEQNVVVDYEKIHATGERAVYSADTDLIEMTGQPTWRIEQREGGGEVLIFDRTNRLFRANGRARLRMPAQNLGAPGLLSRPGAASAQSPPADHFVEITCDNYEVRTNVAIFRQEVRVSDRLGPQPQGELRCGLMTVTLAGTNELQRIVAENQVVLGQGDRQFIADKAEYTGTNGVLDLIGHPAWRDGPRAGKGDVMRVHLAREEMLVLGNAVMQLPATELGQTAFAATGAPKRGEAKAATNAVAEIFSRDYFVTPQSALFRGGVRIEHPQMKWACEEITMLSPPELGKDGRIILAEPAVVFDVVDDEGRNLRGTGDKAVYTHSVTARQTNDTVVLTGRPATVTATNLLGRNNLITLDLASHKLMAPGRYRLSGTAPAGAAATWQLPQSPVRR
jgi:lipopolysaccharide export system protein LptA